MLVIIAIAGCALWMFSDARAHRNSGRPVVMTVGNLTIEQPAIWALLGLMLFVVALPLYLAARHVGDE